MRNIRAISANTDPVRYVTTTHNRPDGSIAVELSDNKNLAHDFVSKQNADKIISKIFNPWNREYTSVQLQVNQQRPVYDYTNELN